MSHCHFVPLRSYNFSYNAKVPLPWNPTVYCLIAAISAVPMYMTIELTFQLYATFKKYSGLYFWAILITTWALTIRQIGRVFIYFVPGCNHVFSILFAMVGWCGTVTGFAVVLYSRLHLVVRNPRILRFVLIMIISDALMFHVPTMVGQIGTVSGTHKDWISWYPSMEKAQITGFAIQETIISGIYIWAARRIVKESYNAQTKTSIRLLVVVQVFAISCHLPLIVLAYADYFVIKASLQSLVYAIKLKLEFIVLNQLLDIVKNGIAPRGIPDSEQRNAIGVTDPKLVLGTRRLSLAFALRRRSMTPRESVGIGKSATKNWCEKKGEVLSGQAVLKTPGNDPECGLPAVPTVTTTGNLQDDEISPDYKDDSSFTNSEKQYLGQFARRSD